MIKARIKKESEFYYNGTMIYLNLEEQREKNQFKINIAVLRQGEPIINTWDYFQAKNIKVCNDKLKKLLEATKNKIDAIKANKVNIITVEILKTGEILQQEYIKGFNPFKGNILLCAKGNLMYWENIRDNANEQKIIIELMKNRTWSNDNFKIKLSEGSF